MSNAKSVTDKLLDASALVNLFLLPYVGPSTTGSFVESLADESSVSHKVFVDFASESTLLGILPFSNFFPYERTPSIAIQNVIAIIMITVPEPNGN